nr:hypothetical protein CFP56_50940 [Quercus suber]
MDRQVSWPVWQHPQGEDKQAAQSFTSSPSRLRRLRGDCGIPEPSDIPTAFTKFETHTSAASTASQYFSLVGSFNLRAVVFQPFHQAQHPTWTFLDILLSLLFSFSISFARVFASAVYTILRRISDHNVEKYIYIYRCENISNTFSRKESVVRWVFADEVKSGANILTCEIVEKYKDERTLGGFGNVLTQSPYRYATCYDLQSSTFGILPAAAGTEVRVLL